MDWRLELVAIPVPDVERAKAFFVEKAGFHADHDHQVNDELRFVQLSPPGSAQVQLVVADIETARQELVDRSVDVREVQDLDWGSFVFFDDPDGNHWAVQQVIPRTRT